VHQGREAKEESPRYAIPDNAMRVAKRWSDLPPSAREAVQRLLDVLHKMSVK
jgi:hypothetical protein